MLKYWLTTQWPNRRSGRRDAPHSGVWVADNKRDVIAPMRVGDLVWMYESINGRPIIQERADGEVRTIRHHRGRGGIVTLAVVTEEAEEDPEREPETYGDGTSIWWRWHAKTRIVNSAGFIPREEVNELLGYKPNNPLRGFGTQSSGLAEIPAEVHQEILERFNRSHQTIDDERLRQGGSARRGGKGGEGPVHKRLKKAISENPSKLLEEGGLETFKEEYPFGATGDKIDVLLRDRYGRLVAVEVEPECPEGHMSGPLQCMKYRALLAYHFDREVEEIRTFLVTHALHSSVEEKATKYEIECKQIDKNAGQLS